MSVQESGFVIRREMGDNMPYVEVFMELEDMDIDRLERLVGKISYNAVLYLTAKQEVYEKFLFRRSGKYYFHDSAEAICEWAGGRNCAPSQKFFFKAKDPKSLETIYLLVRSARLSPRSDFEAKWSALKKLFMPI